MNWAEISILTTHEATDAVSNIFHDLGASGVVIEDPELLNSYLQAGIWDYCDIPEALDTETVTVKAYLLADEDFKGKLSLFEARVNELVLHDLDKGQGIINWCEVHEEDWESSWKEYFHPLRIGEHLVVKPSWEEYEAVIGDVIIELDPGMAFGTGTHHTTTMCSRGLEEVIKPGDVVFDIGTGSGILAIAAAKLGAASVQAVDLDVVAVQVANENVVLNHVEDIVHVAQGDLLTGVTGQADVILANIIADVIIKLAVDVPARLKDHGYFVASGIILDRLSDVTATLLENNLIVEKVTEEGGWVALVVRKGGV